MKFQRVLSLHKINISELKKFKIQKHQMNYIPRNKKAFINHLTCFFNDLYDDLIVWGDKEVSVSVETNGDYCSIELEEIYPFYKAELFFSLDLKKDYENIIPATLDSMFEDETDDEHLYIQPVPIERAKDLITVLSCMNVLNMDKDIYSSIINNGLGFFSESSVSGYTIKIFENSNKISIEHSVIGMKFEFNKTFVSFSVKKPNKNTYDVVDEEYIGFNMDFSTKNFFEISEIFNTMLKYSLQSHFSEKIDNIVDFITLKEMENI